MIFIIIAAAGLFYACIQAFKAWGILGGAGVVIVGVGLMVFLGLIGNIAAIVFSIAVISFGRHTVMQRIVDEVNHPPR